jgi:hypothetical protein
MTEGLLCRCSVCGREERTGDHPLRDGWPTCCGYAMTLIDTERFIASVDEEVRTIVREAGVSAS